jgi:hypothetical protein
MTTIVIGIVLLYVGAESLVRGSSRLAAHFGDYVIGSSTKRPPRPYPARDPYYDFRFDAGIWLGFLWAYSPVSIYICYGRASEIL